MPPWFAPSILFPYEYTHIYIYTLAPIPRSSLSTHRFRCIGESRGSLTLLGYFWASATRGLLRVVHE